MKKEYGVKYSDDTGPEFNGYIKFCGINQAGAFLFREDLQNGMSNTIIIEKGRLNRFSNSIKNIVSYTSDGSTMYYLCQNPNSVLCSKPGTLPVELPDDISPLFVAVTHGHILVTAMPAQLLIISRITCQITKVLDLHPQGYIEPIYVEEFSNNTFLLTDSSNHTVSIIDTNAQKLWEYGTANDPGDLPNQLCVPTSAVRYKDYIVISEQRNHRILFVNQSKEIEYQLGTAGYVGTVQNFLWAPQAAIHNDELYVVMCKGGNILIKKLDCNTKSLTPYYGHSKLQRSDFNFPRACDYSEAYRMLLVCDTYHNRVLLYDEDGNIQLELNRANGIPFAWPRCGIWVDDKIIITDSNNRRILVFAITGDFIEEYNIPSEQTEREWIQSIDVLDGKMLIAFESFVMLIEWKTKTVLWTSKSIKQLELKDIHYAQYLGAFNFLISDTGHNRGVYICNDQCRMICSVGNKQVIQLYKPRFMRLVQNKLYIANSATSQIMICNGETLEIEGLFGGNRGLGYDRLSIPRWLSVCENGTVFISDTDNHRVICRTPLDYSL